MIEVGDTIKIGRPRLFVRRQKATVTKVVSESKLYADSDIYYPRYDITRTERYFLRKTDCAFRSIRPPVPMTSGH